MLSRNHAAPAAGAADRSWMEAFTPGRLALVIALFLFVLYPAVILGAQTFFYQDYGLFTYPNARYLQDCLWRGEVPLWNPLNNCGVPFLAQWNTSVCYPPALVAALLPLPWALNILVLGHLVLAGVGMYLLAWRWTQNRLAASIAGVAFGLNGLLLNCLLWTSNLAALSWQPWVILAVTSAWQRGGGRRLAGAALVGAMQMLSGAPEIILFTWLLLAALWLRELGRRRAAAGPALRRFAVVMALVAGLAAVQLLPFRDLVAHSDRDTSYGEADAWPLPAWGWANLIVPQFHAVQSLLDTYHLADQYWTKSYYVGTGVLVLAFVGAWRGRPWQARWLAGAALLGLVLAAGHKGFLYPWLKSVVPAIGFARYPVKFIALPVFALPLLAACGLQALLDAPAPAARRNLRLLLGTGAFFLILAAGVLVAAHRSPASGENWAMTCRDGAERILFLAGVIGGVGGLLAAGQSRTRTLLGAAVVVLVGLDLVGAGRRMHPTVTPRVFGPIELNLASRPRLGESRALVSRQAEAFLNRVGMTNAVAYCATVRGALFHNNNLLENIPKADGFCSLRLRRTTELLAALADTNQLSYSNLLASPLADFLGVAWVTAPDNVFAWQARAGAGPLITAGQRPIFADEAQTRTAVTAGDFLPREVVYLPTTARAQVGAAAVPEARILSPQWSAERVRFRVQTPAPALVVIAQSFYPNWRAWVDGRPVRLWRANYACQALEVPAGQHEVSLVYRDRAFTIGAILSALSLGICLVLLWRREAPDATPPAAGSREQEQAAVGLTR